MSSLRENLIGLFTEEIFISFWTHESCPPGKDVDGCPKNESGKHEPCMPCWKEWLTELNGKYISLVR